MPPVSQAQRGAMYAAASGHSTLGIPKKVGKEFVQADKPGKLPARKSSLMPDHQRAATTVAGGKSK
jgi:hypothetical protein